MVFARQIVTSVSKVATGAVRRPLGGLELALGVAKHGVAKGTAIADFALTQLHSPEWKARHAQGQDAAGAQADRAAADAARAMSDRRESESAPAATSSERAEPDDRVEEAGAESASAPRGAVDGLRPTPDEIRDLPMPVLEPPVPVVEDALADEAAGPEDGRATEPKPASRDEAHGDAALQRAEADEIAEEVAEAFPAGAVPVETPVGTTGADAGYNPDTADADLQQPGTPALLDEATAKSVEAETAILSKAADPDKS